MLKSHITRNLESYKGIRVILKRKNIDSDATNEHYSAYVAY